ncbi:hypothetical protein K7G98_08990 [Saccharothrix sp. MB29]|nr:hypothetical protein [Saccharothrix sp. MB29]
MARKSYVDPRVVKAFQDGVVIRPRSAEREEVERAVLRLLGKKKKRR